jgi:hypothetical protein
MLMRLRWAARTAPSVARPSARAELDSHSIGERNTETSESSDETAPSRYLHSVCMCCMRVESAADRMQT